MNLLTKLNEKFKNIKDETKKRITATILAGGIALSGLGMAGCNNTTKDPGNTNPPIVTPGGDETGGTENGGSQTPGNNNGGNQNEGESQTPDYSKYSQILQNVLTDQYYKDLITTDRVASKDYGDKNSYQSGKFKALPLAFLEDEGYDIEKIKKNQLGSHSNFYTIGNDLFIELKVETKESTDYYTHYLVKYNLTNQELKELNALFVNVRSNRHSGKVTNYQAPFFIQELSYNKEPVVLSKMYMTRESYVSVVDYFDRYNYNSASNSITYLNREVLNDISHITDHTFQTHMFMDGEHSSASIKSNGKLNTITLQTGGTCCTNIGSSIVFTVVGPTFHFFSKQKENYKNSTTDITLYSCENANFEELNTKTFNYNLSL